MAKSVEGKPVKKTVAVAEAVKALGPDASLRDMAGWLMSTYGYTMSASMISQYRKKIVSGGSKSGSKAYKQAPSVAAPKSSSSAKDDIVNFLRLVREYEPKLGAESMKSLIDVVCGK
jgi:hypothetical protein